MTALGTANLAAASIAMVVGAALSVALALGVHRPMLVASLRMVVQLLLVGLLLRWVFALASPWITALVVVAMLLAAAQQVGSRQERRLRGGWHYLVGGVPTALGTVVVVLLALGTAVGPLPHWYDARQAIPLAGIVLGTATNAASVTLHHLFDAVVRERDVIETRLALGADRATACHDLIRRSTTAGLLPVLNQMTAAGVITLPGIMTGQLLAGMDPTEAAKYQIALMFLLGGASFFATYGAVRLAVHRLTDERHRLRLDRVRAAVRR